MTIVRTILAAPFFLIGAPLVYPGALAAHGGGPHTKAQWAVSYALMVPMCIGWPFFWIATKIMGE